MGKRGKRARSLYLKGEYMANRVTFAVEVPPLLLSHTLAGTALGNSNPIKIAREKVSISFLFRTLLFVQDSCLMVLKHLHADFFSYLH